MRRTQVLKARVAVQRIEYLGLVVEHAEEPKSGPRTPVPV